jgi:hypothetical protein
MNAMTTIDQSSLTVTDLRGEAEGSNPTQATEDDLRTCRSRLVANYTRGTVATKLAAIR